MKKMMIAVFLVVLASAGLIYRVQGQSAKGAQSKGDSEKPKESVDLDSILKDKKLSDGGNLVYEHRGQKLFADVSNGKIVGWHVEHILTFNSCDKDAKVCCACEIFPAFTDPFGNRHPASKVCFNVGCSTLTK